MVFRVDVPAEPVLNLEEVDRCGALPAALAKADRIGLAGPIVDNARRRYEELRPRIDAYLELSRAVAASVLADLDAATAAFDSRGERHAEWARAGADLREEAVVTRRNIMAEEVRALFLEGLARHGQD